MVYHLDMVQAECGSVVLLKFVESFVYGTNPEDVVIDKLKDDIVFTLRTISGHTYTISARTIQKQVGSDGGTLADLTQAIFDKWKHIHRGK